MLLQPNDHVLFFGDSITDANRSREAAPNENAGWGVGYAMMCAAALQARFPELNLVFSNKGCSGNRIYDLESRLDADVLSLKPNLVSILIGINDTWRHFDSGVESPIEDFAHSYRKITRQIVDSGAKLVILEPFVLPTHLTRSGCGRVL